MTTIHSSFSGHTLYVGKLHVSEVASELSHWSDYKEFWVVKNWDKSGVTFMYLGRGHAQAPRQIVAWYPGGKMWSSFGMTLKAAIEGAQRDGWLYA